MQNDNYNIFMISNNNNIMVLVSLQAFVLIIMTIWDAEVEC